MEPQQQKVSKELVGPTPRGRRSPRRYHVCVRGAAPDDLGLRVAELHAAALMAARAGPPLASQERKKRR